MKLKTTAFLGVTLLLLLAGLLATPTTYADGLEFSGFKDPKNGRTPIRGSATLARENNQITITANIEGLNSDHVFSVWGKINSGSSFNLTGFETDGGGIAVFGGVVNLNKKVDLTRFDLIIKDHGEAVQGGIQRQKKTKDFNCDGSCPEVAKGFFD